MNAAEMDGRNGISDDLWSSEKSSQMEGQAKSQDEFDALFDSLD